MADRYSIILTGLLLCSLCFGTPVDQSQLIFEKENDWSSGTAQSFTAGTTGLLKGIRLPMLRFRGERDLTLELKHIDENEIPTGPVLASGMIPGSSFIVGTTQWYTVEFDVPYEQQEGERLSFTVQIGPWGDPYGWLEFGQSINNPYPGGLMYYTSMYGPNGWSYDEGHLDFAFETLVIPKPQLMIEGITPENFSFSIPQSYTDLVYRVECRTNLTSGTWNTYSSITGTLAQLLWAIPVNSETNRAFFRVKVEELSE